MTARILWRRPVPAIALLTVTIVTGACVGAPGSDVADMADMADVAVRPFEEIQDGELTFEADPLEPSRGIFRVTTTEPAICAIVWGETDEFGRFNNSLSMNGTGIVQHDVVLPDLEQGRPYRFIVQGSTADGTLYRSDVGSFTIPETHSAPAATPTDRGDNLALDATVADVSSEFGDGFGAANAIDGDLSTEWSSAGDGDGASITLRLEDRSEVSGLAFLTRSMADGSAVTEEFTVTVDGAERLGPFPAGSPADPRVAEVQATARELRFEVASSTGGNVGAVEIQVFAP